MIKIKDLSASAKKNWELHRDQMLKSNVFVLTGNSASLTAEVIAKKKETFARIGHVQGSKNSQFGTCWVTNGGKPVKIKQDQLENFLSRGYVRGRNVVPQVFCALGETR